MINHLRTLLLDIDGNKTPGPDYPGEEYVPPDFRTVVMPGLLRQAWRILFGVAPDRAYCNFRLRQYTTLLHDCELADYVTALDPRVTYWPHASVDDRWAQYNQITVTPIEIPRGDIRVLGKTTADDTIGKSLFEWRVEVLSGNQVKIDDEFFAVTYSGGISTPVPLDRGLSITVRDFPGDAWYVSSLSKPGPDIGIILANLDNGLGAASGTLFSGGEPYDTMGRLWSRADFLPYRLGALLISLAYRINESRSNP